jgi:hypothetical protein
MAADLYSTLTAGLCAAAISSVASADLTYSFTNRTFVSGYGLDQIFTPAQFSGTLTGASIDVTFLGGNTPPTQANDLAIWIQKPIAGGWATIGGRYGLDSQLYPWPGGQDTTPGTRVVGSVTLDAPVSSINGIYLGITLPWNPGALSGTWSGSVTLIGLQAVPAPSAFALLGLAGLSRSRRRR